MRPIDADALKQTMKNLVVEGGHKYWRAGAQTTIDKIMPKVIDDEPTIEYNDSDNCHTTSFDNIISMVADELYNKNEYIIKIYESNLVNAETLSTAINEAKLDHLVTQLKLKCDIVFNKDELIKALNYDRNEYRKGFLVGYSYNKWIDVDVKLPEDKKTVLIFCGLDKSSYVAYYDKDYECWFSVDIPNRHFNFSTITHWQPLPNPPETFIKKEDDKNETFKI